LWAFNVFLESRYQRPVDSPSWPWRFATELGIGMKRTKFLPHLRFEVETTLPVRDSNNTLDHRTDRAAILSHKAAMRVVANRTKGEMPKISILRPVEPVLRF